MKYLKSFNENMNMAKSIVSKKIEAFDKLKELLSKNLGYIGKFTQYLIEENVPYNELVNLYSDLVELKKKNVNIDINQFTFEKLSDKIIKERNNLDVNSLVSEFPSEQKKLIKDILSGTGYHIQEIYNALLKINSKENKKVFISKISRYKTSEEIINSIKIFSKDAKNNIDYVKEYVSESKTSTIILEKNNLLIVKTDSIKDVQVLGSDTSWCILRQHNWDTYTKNRLQYILFDYNLDDFNPKFKIGFTLNKDATIHAAHDILDSNSINYFKELLSNNQIELKDVISGDLVDISNIVLNGRTSITTWKMVADSISIEQSEEYLIKFLDIVGVTYDKNSNMPRSKKALTDGQSDILSKFLKKLCKKILNDPYLTSYNYILSMNQVEKLDTRIIYYLKTNYMVIPSKEIPYNFNETQINKYFDKFEPIAFIKLVTGMPSSIIYGWGYSSKEGELKYSVDSLTKIYNIVTDNINLIKDDKNEDIFYQGYAFLSKLLNKQNKYLKYLNLDDVAHHNNFFKEEIDLSKIKNLYYLKIRDFDWVSYIIKKDYLDLYMNIVEIEVLNGILNHLEGYNLVIKLNTGGYTYLKTKIRQKHTKVNNNLLTNLPNKSTKTEFISEDGKHKIILTK
jgi:hypothetical protein